MGHIKPIEIGAFFLIFIRKKKKKLNNCHISLLSLNIIYINIYNLVEYFNYYFLPQPIYTFPILKSNRVNIMHISFLYPQVV